MEASVVLVETRGGENMDVDLPMTIVESTMGANGGVEQDVDLLGAAIEVMVVASALA